ncbi:hypothetical protein [Chromobacterium sp. ATCC 53434]|uniref:hypothetical protein n=1 Tax=Chromobacterium sp. (strain ATCC 53434 / SC 14030) TaxID=2059672 RepID=UPI0013053A86|nr:hypothetical protein [Chromobacterium sp. ATCC 53434]
MSNKPDMVDFGKQPKGAGVDASKKRLAVFGVAAIAFFAAMLIYKKVTAPKEAPQDQMALASTPEKMKDTGTVDAGTLAQADNHNQPALYGTADALLNTQQAGREKSAIASGGAYVAEVGALSERGPDPASPQQGSGGGLPPVPQGGALASALDAASVQKQGAWLQKFQRLDGRGDAPAQDRKLINWYGAGAAPPVALRGSDGGGGDGGRGQYKGSRIAFMGERVAAVTLNETSSYQQGTTVMVRIVEDGGKRDAQLFGTYSEGYDALVVKLSKMRLADGRVVPVDAVLVDKQTNSQAVASAVKGHYLDRFGMIAAGAFLGSYATALTSGGETTVVNGGAVTTVPRIDQPAKFALGKTVEAVSQVAAAGAARFNKSEVILNRSELVGVLFLDDAFAGGS